MNKTTEFRISNTLKHLGISPVLLGYKYLREAIRLSMGDNSFVDGITKKLYPTIAKIFNTTPVSVERAIRHAIENGWLRGNTEIIDELFGYTVDANKDKPTNGEFIATVTDYLLITQGD